MKNNYGVIKAHSLISLRWMVLRSQQQARCRISVSPHLQFTIHLHSFHGTSSLNCNVTFLTNAARVIYTTQQLSVSNSLFLVLMHLRYKCVIGLSFNVYSNFYLTDQFSINVLSSLIIR